MKATIPQLKKKINSLADKYGYAFDKNAPYYVNDGRIKAIEAAIITVKEDGEANPTRRYEISEKQLVSLNNWVRDLKHKYL
ncbi:hypothetical protein KVP40.0266 [Vibrio phage KVP40]|uniref:Uncharacterized protein n=3 Tax=Schizotequatrovirus KVP40 TaxID=1914019 RepID=Q6WHN8_BPKVM|nr:hypothetical protein KVP40.0266 [Vibrio phage KVP40]AAQ64335.1 hypothetical protein KVP40.0266 [Vibrio phage KVP40]AFN37495.1 hypothetical protein pp2_262 [Vibrio phage phi-pp2]QIW91149.1 hypothetical protein COHAPHLL_00313 [Vibrio phage V09]WOL24798.1 hypothetical protein [Vibrio phage PG216]